MSETEKLSTASKAFVVVTGLAIATGAVAGAIVEPQELINLLPIHVDVDVRITLKADKDNGR